MRENRTTTGLGYQYKPRLRTALSLGFDCPDFLTPQLADITLPFLCFHGAADEVGTALLPSVPALCAWPTPALLVR